MRKITLILGLLITGVMSAQQIDSLDIYHPDKRMLHRFYDNKDLGKKLDSLNVIYRTHEFFVKAYSGRTAVTKRFITEHYGYKKVIKRQVI